MVQRPPNFNLNNGNYRSGPIFSLEWVKLLGLGALGVIVMVSVVRRVFSPHAGHGLHRVWPAVVAILFLAFIFLGTARKLSETNEVAVRSREHAEEMAARQRAILVAKKKTADQIHTMQQLAQTDIHAEMDQFDSPRIPLPSEKTAPKSPSAPAAPATPAAPTQPEKVSIPIEKSAAKTNKDDVKKLAATSNSKRKKSDKAPVPGDSDQSQIVAESKAAQKQETILKKVNKSSSDKEAMVAEAESEKPKTRPAWIDEPPKRSGNVRREVIATEEYVSVDECYQAADIYLLLKTFQRMRQLAGRQDVDGPLPSLTFHDGTISADGNIIFSRTGGWADVRLDHLNSLGITADYLRTEIVAKDPKNNEPREYVDTVERSIGPMKKLFLQVEFTPSIDRDLQRHWDAYERQERFAMFGVGAGSILGLLGTFFALLKIDTATKGYYTKRLFVGVPLAILGIFSLYAMLVELGVKLPH